MAFLKKPIDSGAREMAYLVKCLLRKCENLNLDRQHHIRKKKPEMITHVRKSNTIELLLDSP